MKYVSTWDMILLKILYNSYTTPITFFKIDHCICRKRDPIISLKKKNVRVV